MKQDLVGGVDANDCEQEYMFDKLYEKFDLCSHYIEPEIFPPDNGHL